MQKITYKKALFIDTDVIIKARNEEKIMELNNYKITKKEFMEKMGNIKEMRKTCIPYNNKDKKDLLIDLIDTINNNMENLHISNDVLKVEKWNITNNFIKYIVNGEQNRLDLIGNEFYKVARNNTTYLLVSTSISVVIYEF